MTRSAGKSAELSGPQIADGKWHHILGEVDRQAGALRLYVDGKLATEAPLSLAANASLSTDAPFRVGGGIVGAIDFLRISRGSLKDAQTTIDELYAWQFDGPQFRDFAGRMPQPGSPRAVGALEPAAK